MAKQSSTVPKKASPAAKKPAATARKKPAARKSTKKKKGFDYPWRTTLVIVLLVLFSPLYYGYVLNFFTGAVRWVKDIGENPHYRTYHSFQIRIPARYKIHGIDVSYAQGHIDWQRVKQMEEDSVHISFAFIKATEGMLIVDSYFKRNWREAAKNGIVCGAYHFFRPQKNGQWQARFFMQNVTFEKGDLPPVVDVETLDGVSPANMRKELQQFLTTVERKTGVRPIIYTGISYYQDYLAGHFEDYPLWIAHYNQPELQIDKSVKWHFWQHSETARVNGINHTVDFDAFNGDSLAFTRMLIR
ncbi:lysozyme [Mucilaginibacter yixingensis]|uniref:Lysozyme n=1 Tax=Mucilaginibacter yixingensis TaxID=1295612 RepID=A0A2T5J6P3_9SPHI|nr:glycoside hydrolase family 25 protein [Mucilaginibacter yixingensis]PTQ94822.1 lysozyme [Mucilaginibacter yixingensis]